MVITSDELLYDSKEKRAWTNKPFKLVQTKDGKTTQTITGQKLEYHFGNETAEVTDAILEMPAKAAGQNIHITARKLKSINRSKFILEDGTFTTCSLLEEEHIPHYHIAAKTMDYIPEVSLSGWHTTMYVNNRPVFYLPYYWIPLSRPDNNNFEIGQNDIEGRFLKTRYGYALSPYHSGTLYNNLMEYKKYGVGFDHLWKADPNSQTVVSFYGLPIPDEDDIKEGGDNWIKYGLNGTPFQDHMFHFYHQQNILGMRANVKYEDMNMYSFTNLPANVSSNTNRRFLPQLREVYNSHELGLSGTFGSTNFALNRNFREAKSAGNVTTNHTGRFGTQIGALRVDANSTWNESGQWVAPIYQSITQTSKPQTNWTNNVTLNHNWAGGPNTTLTLNHWKRDYPSLMPNAVTLDEQVDPTLTMRQNFGWGNATLNVQHRFDLSPNSLRPEIIRSRSYINKEPELLLESNSILQDYQPFRVTMGLGRYFESSSYEPDTKPKVSQSINRFNPEFSLVNKQHDIKIGKLDFGGTGLRQFFYSTGDSQYSVNFNSTLTSEIGDHLGTTFAYSKVMTDPKNNTPFKFDNLGLAKNNTLNGTVVVKGTKDESGNIPFNWTSNSGYDFERERFLNLNSTLNYTPNKLVTLQMQSGYDFEDVPYLSLRNGSWSPLGMTLNIRSKEGDFGNVFGLDKLSPGWEFNNTLSYDFMKGQWGSLQNSLRVAIGDRWQNHWEFKITGAYDYGGTINGIETEKGYHLNEISLSRDLHDYILTLAYNRQAQTYMLRLTMTAFGTDLINFNQTGFSAGGVNIFDPGSYLPKF